MSMRLVVEFELKRAIENKEYEGHLCTIEEFTALKESFPKASTSFETCSTLDINIARLKMKFSHQLKCIHYSYEISTGGTYYDDTAVKEIYTVSPPIIKLAEAELAKLQRN